MINIKSKYQTLHFMVHLNGTIMMSLQFKLRLNSK